MKINRDDLHIIYSMANHNVGTLTKPSSIDAQEFVSMCWILAINSRFNLQLNPEFPLRFDLPEEPGFLTEKDDET